MEKKRALAKEAAAAVLGLAPKTLGDRRWRTRVGLHAVRIGRRLRFQEKDLLTLLNRSREDHADDHGEGVKPPENWKTR